jgi:AraC-like DNA-binding protein
MIDDFNLILLSGGRYLCDPTWTKHASSIDECFKVYYPVSGEACLEMDSGQFPIEAKGVYFVSGFRLRRQACPTAMEVYWLHFVPVSLYLRYLLDRVTPVLRLLPERAGWSTALEQDICKCFDNPFRDQNLPRPDATPAIACRLQGFLLTLVSRLLETLKPEMLREFHPEFLRLKPALDFMHRHYRDNPSLERVAAVAGLAPNYFHRRFHRLFGLTPFNYMLNQRLNQARHLLASTPLSVKEVAGSVGYADQLYFTRVFAHQMQMSPSEYRKAHRFQR